MMVRLNQLIVLTGICLVLINAACDRHTRDHPASAPLFTGDTIVVGAYNVENLFDLVDDGGEYPEYKPDQFNWNTATYTAKLTNCAQTLSALNADIVVLCEIENAHTAAALRLQLKKNGTLYYYTATGDKPSRTNTMPVIFSRLPLVNIHGYAMPGEGTHPSRNLLVADALWQADTLTILACHWPSKRAQESARVAAARRVKMVIDSLPKSRQFCVAGDLNASYNECETFGLRKLDDTHGVTGINHILKTALSSAGEFPRYVTKSILMHDTADGLFNPWLDVPQERRFSMIYKQNFETIDHLLLSRTLFDSSGLSYCDSSFTAFTNNGLLLNDGVPWRWQYRYSKNGKYHLGKGYSDHLPVLLKLVRGPFHTHELVSEQSIPQQAVMDFESGFDRFAARGKGITGTRDSTQAAHGLFSFKVAGTTGKANSTVAQALIPLDKKNVRGDTIALGLLLRGEGAINLRLRYGIGRWTYASAPLFTAAKSGKYNRFYSKRFVPLRLPLAINDSGPAVITLELRSAKNSVVCVWIDDVRVQ